MSSNKNTLEDMIKAMKDIHKSHLESNEQALMLIDPIVYKDLISLLEELMLYREAEEESYDLSHKDKTFYRVSFDDRYTQADITVLKEWRTDHHYGTNPIISRMLKRKHFEPIEKFVHRTELEAKRLFEIGKRIEALNKGVTKA